MVPGETEKVLKDVVSGNVKPYLKSDLENDQIPLDRAGQGCVQLSPISLFSCDQSSNFLHSGTYFFEGFLPRIDRRKKGNFQNSPNKASTTIICSQIKSFYSGAGQGELLLLVYSQ